MSISTLPRAKSFRDEIAALVRDCEPDELIDRLFDLHQAQLAPAEAQLAAAVRESTQVHTDARRMHYVLSQVENLAAHQVQLIARQGATLAHQREQLRRVRGAAQAAFDGRVPAEDLAAILAETIADVTPHDIMLGFHPSEQFRGGVFASADNQVRVTYTFIGWTSVARFAGGPIQVEATFLVTDRGALPASVIEAERGLRLQMPLLPALGLAV
jgi:hypothetical protein